MLNMRLFDPFSPSDIAALPKKLRGAIIADRTAVTTEELRRNAESRKRQRPRTRASGASAGPSTETPAGGSATRASA